MLTPEQIGEIRRRLDAGERGVDLAREYGVSKQRISRIKAMRSPERDQRVRAHNRQWWRKQRGKRVQSRISYTAHLLADTNPPALSVSAYDNDADALLWEVFLDAATGRQVEHNKAAMSGKED